MFGGLSHRARTAPGSLGGRGPSDSVPVVACAADCSRRRASVGQPGDRFDRLGRLRCRLLNSVIPSAASMATTKSPFSAKELSGLRKQLVEEREELQKQVAGIEESSFGNAQSELTGELASFDEEYADAATETFEREKDLSITNNIRDLTDQIDRALERIDEGNYGLCERCGRPIEKARIKALPYATLCIKDKQAEERSG